MRLVTIATTAVSSYLERIPHKSIVLLPSPHTQRTGDGTKLIQPGAFKINRITHPYCLASSPIAFDQAYITGVHTPSTQA